MPYAKPPDPPWLLDLRRKVKARLRQQGATQAGLAWHLGITEKHVCQLLSGKVTGTPEMLDRLAGAVGLQITLADSGTAPSLPGRRALRRRQPREGGTYERLTGTWTGTGWPP